MIRRTRRSSRSGRALVDRRPRGQLGLARTARGRLLAICGSNWVPAQRSTSASASSRVSARRYGRSLVIASKASATASTRASSGISSPALPGRVARAVPALVVVEHVRDRVAQRRDAEDEPRADLRVLPDLGQLVVVEPPCLAEDLVGDARACRCRAAGRRAAARRAAPRSSRASARRPRPARSRAPSALRVRVTGLDRPAEHRQHRHEAEASTPSARIPLSPQGRLQRQMPVTGPTPAERPSRGRPRRPRSCAAARSASSPAGSSSPAGRAARARARERAGRAESDSSKTTKTRCVAASSRAAAAGIASARHRRSRPGSRACRGRDRG